MKMNIGVWIAQVLLALVFMRSGAIKAFAPGVVEMVPWVQDSPTALVRVIGIVELDGGLAVLLPTVLRVVPKLSAVAAAGLALVMLLATCFHLYRGEVSSVTTPVVLLLVAIFVAIGRWKLAPIDAR